MSLLTLDQIGKPRALRECSIEELAVHQITAKVSGGVAFARTRERGEKDEARRYIVELVEDKQRFPTLRMLTMPGVDWRFENKVLGRREGNWIEAQEQTPQCTHLVCAENDRSLYHAAITRMPGVMRSDWANARRVKSNLTIRSLGPTPFAERTVSNKWLEAFYFANVDDLMWQDTSVFDAAWLDYTGPLSVNRMAIIKQFFAHSVRDLLVITALKARWNTPTVQAIDKAGSYAEWVLRSVPGVVEHYREYQDTASPMVQIAIRKERP